MLRKHLCGGNRGSIPRRARVSFFITLNGHIKAPMASYSVLSADKMEPAGMKAALEPER